MPLLKSGANIPIDQHLLKIKDRQTERHIGYKNCSISVRFIWSILLCSSYVLGAVYIYT